MTSSNITNKKKSSSISSDPEARKIAFVTYYQLPNLSYDDNLAKTKLEKSGFIVQSVCWNDAQVNWEYFDLIILRSTWDYHLNSSEFFAWINKIENLNIPLWNQPNILKWNLEKYYLLDLSKKGVTIVPTVWLEKNDTVKLNEILESQRWETAVIKPSVSATAHNTHLISKKNTAQFDEFINEQLKECHYLVQKFLPEIQANGEWSIIFFNKKYSHSVLKKAKKGDFRVQESFGGSINYEEPSKEIIVQAQNILNLIPFQLLYARVDGVVIDNVLILMELELIEPALFFAHSKKAINNFVMSVSSLLER